MALGIRLIGSMQVRVTGIDVANVPKGQWRAAMDYMGAILQSRVAASFATQRTQGTRWLDRNSAEWDAYKRKHNLDHRRGHATGNLQNHLNAQERLYSITAIVNGTATLTMREDWLQGRVPYAEFYAAKKVNSKGILALAKSWVADASRELYDLAALALKRKQPIQTAAALHVGTFAGKARAAKAALNLAAMQTRRAITSRYANVKAGLRDANALSDELSRILNNKR